jgi:hypothetical protein
VQASLDRSQARGHDRRQGESGLARPAGPVISGMTPGTSSLLNDETEQMMNYTVRFDRGNRGWTCSVYTLDANGVKAGAAVATGSGNTQDAAKGEALSLAVDVGIRIALKNADPRRPHWMQGGKGEQIDADRRAEASRVLFETRTKRLSMMR